jgi:beta-N-acetylhexosaminidase
MRAASECLLPQALEPAVRCKCGGRMVQLSSAAALDQGERVRQNIGQRLIIGIKGTSLAKDEAEFIARSGIGGVILFARNAESPGQVRQLCADIQALRLRAPDKVPLFIGIDNEGGRVARLKAPFTEWPAAAAIGKIDSTSVAFKFGSTMGEELKAVGINLNFAPCVDVLTNPANPAIGDRSLGSDPELVARLASAIARGFIKADVIACAKHFPGHGNTSVDSHTELPVENRALEELRALELIPFKKALRARLEMVMMSHILFPKIDPEFPASLSPAFGRLLRDELRFRGVVVSDDLGMKAVAARWGVAEVATRALLAGTDLLLYCNEPEAPPAALEAIEKALVDKRLDEALFAAGTKRVLDLKRAKLAKPDPLALEQVNNIVGHPDHLRLAKAIASGTVPDELVASASQSA